MALAPIILTLVFASFLVAPAISGHIDHAAIKAWCSQTPYPQPCEFFMTQDPKYGVPIKGKFHFFQLSTQLALDRSVHAHGHISTLGLKCRNEREKAAWLDCLELYEHTIHRINTTINPKTKSTPADAQTWLSTALTNLETCKAGFEDLGVSDYVLPLMSNNVSFLLSNTLALNKEPYGEPSYKERFPKWIKPGDRKLLQAPNPRANVVVAQDGSGNYRTVSAAVAAVGKRRGGGRYVIYVKQGIYRENVNIAGENIMLLGDGIGRTIITGSKSVGGGSTTFNSATVGVVGDGFIARGITFRNTAGPQNHQAVALRSGSDLSVFYQCSFEGYQDTLYVYSNRQFYRECNIYGTVDFIFGNAAVVLQNCNIFPRNPPNKIVTLTAQGRSDPNQNTGISIHNCRVTAAPDLRPVQGSVRTYLGRPWKQYSRTVFMKTFLDSLIAPAGWMPWSGNFALNTLFYGEFANTGPGAFTGNRVKWPGYHVITSAPVASQFTVGRFIAGNSWLPATNVPFIPGL